MTRAKKFTTLKNHFFHACQPREEFFFNFVHALALFSGLISETLRGPCQIMWPRRPSLFRWKMFAMFMSTSNLMHPEIQEKWTHSKQHVFQTMFNTNVKHEPSTYTEAIEKRGTQCPRYGTTEEKRNLLQTTTILRVHHHAFRPLHVHMF